MLERTVKIGEDHEEKVKVNLISLLRDNVAFSHSQQIK